MTENKHGTGGIISPRNNMIASFGELVADSPIFDWNKGFDIRKKLGRDLSIKDQNGSGSCGGQASAYLTEAVLGSDEISARSIYNKCFVLGGGSSETGLLNTIINSGVDFEKITTSYENGLPPSEEFMQTPDGNPSFVKGLRPVYVDLDFNSIATAVLQNNGVVIGVSGQNNGTWTSAYPKPPSVPMHSNGLWNHWVYVGFAGIRNGKKVFGFKNSWGKDVGENGWQYIDESYLPYIWCAWSVVYRKDTKPRFSFVNQLSFGQSSSDVVKLQDILRYEGVFNNVSTGYYGPLTASAVLAFQKKYNIAPIPDLEKLAGRNVGPLTIKKLNEIYGH